MPDEEKRIADMTANLIRLSQRRYEPCYSDFLSEGEQALAQKYLLAEGLREYKLWGGYEGAVRRMLCVFPEYCEPENEDFPFTPLFLKFRTSAALTHRDFLGALMGLGLKRGAAGDIVIQQGRATFFVKSELAGYVESQLEKVGREGVEFSDTGADLSQIKQNFSRRSCTVSSLRLDLIVGECTSMSRARSQQAVKSGAVAVNALPVCDNDRKIADGDTITVRGHGKYIIHFDGSMSKKGKYRITVSKYL